MEQKKRRLKLFRFYNELGKKFYGSNIHYKDKAAHIRYKLLKKILQQNKPLGLTLDLGCADGYYKPLIKYYVGLDMSLGYLKKFKADRVWGVAQQLPFKNGVFDRIFLSEVLEHIWERKQVLNECYRILKKKGIIIFSAPYGHNPVCTKKQSECLKKYKIRVSSYIHGHFNKKYIRKLFIGSKLNILKIKLIEHKGKLRYVIVVAKK